MTGYLILYLVMPWRLFDSAYVDVRVLVAAMLLLPALVSFVPKVNWQFIVSVAGTILITGALTTNVFLLWRSYQEEYAKVKLSFELIQPKSRILIARSDQRSASDLTEGPIYFAPTLAVYYADAFVPSLYTAPAVQNVRIKSELRRFEITDGFQYLPVPVRNLIAIVNGDDAAVSPPYIHHWFSEFDYLYLVGGDVANPIPALLEELFSSGRFALYRIRKQSKELVNYPINTPHAQGQDN